MLWARIQAKPTRCILDENGVKDMPGSFPVHNTGSFKKNKGKRQMGHTEKRFANDHT